jgi:hypothetical protein
MPAAGILDGHRRTPMALLRVPVLTRIGVLSLCLLAGVMASEPAWCQPDDRATAQAKAQNLALMLRTVSLKVQEQRLDDIVRYITELTGADLEVLYIDSRNPEGLDPERPITLDVQNVSALRLLELTLEQAARDSFEGATWQFTPWGSIEAGLKSSLNRRQRIQIYDIADLLLTVPDFNDAPEIDLQQVVQGGQGGGGGGQGVFGGGQGGGGNNNEDDERDLDERRQEIIGLIEAVIEPDQWQAAGGDGGTITIFQNTLVIRAADYIHRQIDGYPFLPRAAQTIGGAGDRRFVTFNLELGTSNLVDIQPFPVRAGAGDGGGG